MEARWPPNHPRPLLWPKSRWAPWFRWNSNRVWGKRLLSLCLRPTPTLWNVFSNVAYEICHTHRNVTQESSEMPNQVHVLVPTRLGTRWWWRRGPGLNNPSMWPSNPGPLYQGCGVEQLAIKVSSIYSQSWYIHHDHRHVNIKGWPRASLTSWPRQCFDALLHIWYRRDNSCCSEWWGCDADPKGRPWPWPSFCIQTKLLLNTFKPLWIKVHML